MIVSIFDLEIAMSSQVSENSEIRLESSKNGHGNVGSMLYDPYSMRHNLWTILLIVFVSSPK